MEHLKMHSVDGTAANIDRLAELFPAVVTETRDAEGNVSRGIDFDLLRQELSDHVVEGPQERYQMDWPGKREALFAANAPIAKTLRPQREESVDFDTTKNIFIEGDNLDALKLLQESYLGKIKLIYIDPPYNTGRDFIYDDDFSTTKEEYLERSGQQTDQRERLVTLSNTDGRYHSDWLSMMYSRLILAKRLLKDDGAIFISIDDHEVDNLRKICSEIFGDRNFVAQIIWQKVYAPKNSAQWFSEDHDYILIFARDKEKWRPNPLPRTPEMEARYKNPDNDPRGPWKPENITARNPYRAGVYPITTPSGRTIDGPPRGRYWGVSEAKLKELDGDNRIWWGPDGDNAPAVKRFLSEVSSGRTPQTFWPYSEVGHTQDAKKTLLRYVPFEHTANVLNSVKPVELLERILHLGTNACDEDIVMDFFAGSGTTPHAVLKKNAEDGGNRRFIGIQIDEPLPQPEPRFSSILGMCLERLKNVSAELAADSDPENKSGTKRGRTSDNRLDPGFRRYQIDTTNMAETDLAPAIYQQGDLIDLVDNVKPGRTAEDLLFQVILDWGLELSLPVTRETVAGRGVLVVDGGALVASFDDEVTEDLARGIAAMQPLRAVFRDSAFSSDALRINVEQLFTELSSATDVKVI